jgi:hypothetical protein
VWESELGRGLEWETLCLREGSVGQGKRPTDQMQKNNISYHVLQLLDQQLHDACPFVEVMSPDLIMSSSCFLSNFAHARLRFQGKRSSPSREDIQPRCMRSIFPNPCVRCFFHRLSTTLSSCCGSVTLLQSTALMHIFSHQYTSLRATEGVTHTHTHTPTHTHIHIHIHTSSKLQCVRQRGPTREHAMRDRLPRALPIF